MPRSDERSLLHSQVEHLLAAAAEYFKNQEKPDFVRILVNARSSVVEEASYGYSGQPGHEIHLHVPKALLAYIVADRSQYEDPLCECFNKILKIPNEYISGVRICVDHLRSLEDWRLETGALLATPTLAWASDIDLARLWPSEGLRAFLSHRADFKVETTQLKDELASLGISSFVAHEDIHPTQAWQKEIERALASMDVLVAVLTDHFGTSSWTQQEIGIALGRGIPVIALRIDEDPTGFLGSTQAVNGRGVSPRAWASNLVAAFQRHPELDGRVLAGLVGAWERARNFAAASIVIDLMKNYDIMPTSLLARVEKAFASNDQLHKCWGVQAVYPELLAKWKSGSPR